MYFDKQVDITSLDDFCTLMYYCGIGFGEYGVTLQANT